MNKEQCGIPLRLSKNQMLSQDLCVRELPKRDGTDCVLLRHQRSKNDTG
jgi:hypothetical protein